MEFESLTRRELQALCKKNKIPANITNVAMADALKALEIIEGIEEFQRASQSETAESSIDSPEKLEVTSPAVPRTGGRTTRRGTVAKEEPETLQAVTRTRRTTRKTLAKDADATETPAVLQTARRRAPTSVCRKMDAQLKECADEEKKDVLVTPAPSGVTTRRRGAVKEETVVQRAFSTRRSVRLAEKNVEVEKEKSDLFTKDDGETVTMNLKEGLDAMDETSGITGFEENMEEKDESEVVSVEEQHVQIVDESRLIINEDEDNMKGKDESGVLSAQEQDVQIGDKTEPTTTVEDDSVGGPKLEVRENSNLGNEKTCFTFETEMEMDEEKFVVEWESPNGESIVMPLGNEVQESDGSQYVDVSETEFAAEVTESMNADLEAGSEVKALDPVAIAVLETEDLLVDLCEKEPILDEFPDSVVMAAKEEVSDGIYQATDDSTTEMPSQISLMNSKDEAEMEPNVSIFLDAGVTEHDVKPTCLTSIKDSASKVASSARMTVVCDNKENIGSVSKLVLTKERVKISEKAENTRLDDLSLRKLCRMLKQKLEITKKLPKYDIGEETRARPALQALPENRMVDETQN